MGIECKSCINTSCSTAKGKNDPKPRKYTYLIRSTGGHTNIFQHGLLTSVKYFARKGN